VFLKDIGERCESVKFVGEISSHRLGEDVGELEVRRAGCDGPAVVEELAEGWMHELGGGASGSVGSMI